MNLISIGDVERAKFVVLFTLGSERKQKLMLNLKKNSLLSVIFFTGKLTQNPVKMVAVNGLVNQ